MTVEEALLYGTQALQLAGVPDASLDAEYCMAEVLDAPRLLVLMNKQRQLTDNRATIFFEFIERRATREPLQYVLGKQDFMGYTFDVSKDVLIPRGDTETLCEQALLHIQKDAKVLDLCTGSGAIAISMSLLSRDSQVTACDISEAALAVAKQNAKANRATVRFFQGDLFEPVKGETFDIILSNPPYIPSGDLSTLQLEVQQEPSLALDGGEDGLDFYKRIAKEAPLHLTEKGILFLEIGDTQAKDVCALLQSSFDTSLVHDMNGLPRVIIAKKRVGQC